MWLGNTYLEKSILIIIIAVLLIIVGGGATAFVLRPWDTTPDVIVAVQDPPEQAPLPPDRPAEQTAELPPEEPPVQAAVLPPEKPTGHGNTPGNTLAGGEVVYSDGWIYINVWRSALLKTRIDGTEYQLIDFSEISDAFMPGVFNLNVAGGWIYHTLAYITQESRERAGPVETNASIYRIRTDGTDLGRISDDAGTFLNVVDGWIYYVNQDSNHNLYRIRTDGTGREKLSDHVVYILHVMDEWVFYNLIPQEHFFHSRAPILSLTIDDNIELTERSYIYKVRIDGTERTRISDVNSQALLAYDGWIYYTDRDNDLALYRMRADGTEVMRITSDVVHLPNIVDGWIYYIHIASPIHAYQNLFKIRPDGTERQLVYDNRIGHFSIAGGWIFYSSLPLISYTPRYKLSLDGATNIYLRDLR